MFHLRVLEQQLRRTFLFSLTFVRLHLKTQQFQNQYRVHKLALKGIVIQRNVVLLVQKQQYFGVNIAYKMFKKVAFINKQPAFPNDKPQPLKSNHYQKGRIPINAAYIKLLHYQQVFFKKTAKQ
eukprot:TRINITY_DN23124_c0_g1_i1.p3 TRINITY_DN23124_c0_g1~~TRINITY_DN23124_c0_g1_i1.p3  ORF type:complete len:124 (+),score=1.39 TRINITY_DN23124_c0_g1_i1:455-826(+)